MKFKVDWIDAGREPVNPPNPAYPNGVDLDVSHGANHSCIVGLPYPAKRCGQYVILCQSCGRSAIVTTAGRPDDPRSIKLACQLPGRLQ